MQKPITPTVHGALDYSTVLMTAAAPEVLDFPRSARAACYALAGGYAGLSMLTDYPLGVRRTVPFRAHGAIEAVVGLALPALPWLLGFSRHAAARNFCLGLTALTAVTAALTDWDAGEQEPDARPVGALRPPGIRRRARGRRPAARG